MKLYNFLGIRNADFVNIYLENRDVKVFIDPFKLVTRNTDLSYAAALRIQNYFDNLVTNLSDRTLLRNNIGDINEINETKIGYSLGGYGRGVGNQLKEILVHQLNSSDAFVNGLVTQIQDINLFIRNISNDRMSDWLTNIIVDLLIDFTNQQMSAFGSLVGTTTRQYSYWCPETNRWNNRTFSIPLINGIPVILVPKEFVSPERLSLKGLSDFVNMGLLTIIKRDFVAYGLSSLSHVDSDGTYSEPTKSDIVNFHHAQGMSVYQYSTVVWFSTHYPQLIIDAKNEYHRVRLTSITSRSYIIDIL